LVAPSKHYFNTHGVSKSLNLEKHQKLSFFDRIFNLS
jgi:hypothetical protein